MERRLLLLAEVFLSLWCLSHQQERNMTLCRGNESVLAKCEDGKTPVPGQLPPGWGRTECKAGTTPCVLTGESTVELTQHYREHQCNSETWNLTYLCLPADESVDICQDVNQTREGNTSLVHGQLMASRGDNVTCTCVVTRSPGQNSTAILIKSFTRHLAQTPVADAASCQGRLTLTDTLNTGLTLSLLTTRPTGQNSNEVALWPGYAPYLNETNSLTITYKLDGGATWRQDQLLPFALRLSGSGSYDIECGRSDDDVTKSTGSAAPTATTHTNPEFESTSIDNPTTSRSATDSGNGGEDPVTDTTVTFTTEAQPNKGSGSPKGLTIGLAVGLAVVVLVVLVIVVCCLLRKRRMTRDKPDNDVDPYSVTLRRNRKDEPPPESDHESGRPREAEGWPHGDEGRDGSDAEVGSGGGEATGGDGVAVDPSDTYATMDRSRKDRDSADLTMQENNVYGSHSQPIEN